MFQFKSILSLAMVAGAALLLASCGSSSTPANSTPIVVSQKEFHAKKCVRDSVCAEIDLNYPVLSGGADSAMTKRLNDSIQVAVYLAANADPNLPLAQALDSATAALYAMLDSDIKAGSEMGMSYTLELQGKAICQTPGYLSLQMDGYSFTGGAHGYYYTVINTFNLNTSESIHLSSIISDTTVLRTLLEQAFVENHRKEIPDAKLADLLLDPEAPLALPSNYCIVPEGVRFVYNPYEVAPYAVGLTDIVLKWEQLGPIANRDKWLK
ncbi:MAG: DUF3298 and DUF4163 domain-containing protein [Saprospiraceae bacterium]|jgi:hypothetical protein|nr:DUF3298 and DUF4163 domain-containing protein [Saprospiraceae bacterium]